MFSTFSDSGAHWDNGTSHFRPQILLNEELNQVLNLTITIVHFDSQ